MDDEAKNLDTSRVLHTTRTDQNPHSDSDLPDWTFRVADWNAFIRRRGHDYATCRLVGFEIHGNDEETTKQRGAIDMLTRYGQTMRDRVSRGQGIVLVGTTGTGKDHCLTALARVAILEHGLNVAWLDGASFFSQMRDRISENLSERGVMRPLIDADILYLSDPVPASGELTNYQKDRLFDLINARGKKPCWVSCNFKEQGEADDVMSPQLAGRIRDRALAIGFKWESFRKPAPTSGAAADKWWEPPDDGPDILPIHAVVPEPIEPRSDLPAATREQLRDPAAVEALFSECVTRGLIAEDRRREFFWSAAQASLARRRTPRAMLDLFLKHEAWTGDSPACAIPAKARARGDDMLAANWMKIS